METFTNYVNSIKKLETVFSQMLNWNTSLEIETIQNDHYTDEHDP